MRFLIIIVSFMLCGCSMQSYCDKRFPAKEYTTIDTVTRVECWYDTIYIPENIVSIDTVIKEIPFDFVFHKSTRSGGLTATVNIEKGKIDFKCAADSLQLLLENEREVTRISRDQLKVKTAECNLPHKSKFNHFCSYWFWISFGLILLFIILKLVKVL